MDTHEAISTEASLVNVGDIYSKAQQEAWCSTPPDYQRWLERLDNTQPWMAICGSSLAGFVELGEMVT